MTKKIYIYDTPGIEIDFINEDFSYTEIVPEASKALAFIMGSMIPSGVIRNLENSIMLACPGIDAIKLAEGITNFIREYTILDDDYYIEI